MDKIWFVCPSLSCSFSTELSPSGVPVELSVHGYIDLPVNSLFGYGILPQVLHKKGMSLRNALTTPACWPYLMTQVIKLFVL